MIYAILRAVIGCLIGVLFFKLITLPGVLPVIASLGDWSTGILVAFCVVFCEVLGALPWFAKQ